MSERRKFSRINFQCHCSLIFDQEIATHDFDASLVDISFNGALVAVNAFAPDLNQQQVQVILTLEGSEVQLLLNGTVSHQQDQLLGIHFTKTELETMSHLKRLIELNLGNHDEMHREFEQLIEMHIADN
ncbi:PilZ domain-containing protein [Psychromonas sp. SR45-3]|uniref:PilZ domain-containing protein n=1 Tax=Psychromonas sp. SR45-3 TaxID=2760930 RepID=UPI0015F82354|nr:PilZ domain-containing protein [Psychromonas sp. SR45-3]MBB1273003.1 PilZ domain-containing protein [Psychromonas sp. SR45-3]